VVTFIEAAGESWGTNRAQQSGKGISKPRGEITEGKERSEFSFWSGISKTATIL